jgi:hypothetical protein
VSVGGKESSQAGIYEYINKPAADTSVKFNACIFHNPFVSLSLRAIKCDTLIRAPLNLNYHISSDMQIVNC